MAWLSNRKTKTELKAIVGNLDDEPFEDLINGIIDAHKFFEFFVSVLDSARARLLIAAAAVLPLAYEEGANG
jgi:hypothetical protein